LPIEIAPPKITAYIRPCFFTTAAKANNTRSFVKANLWKVVNHTQLSGHRVHPAPTQAKALCDTIHPQDVGNWNSDYVFNCTHKQLLY